MHRRSGVRSYRAPRRPRANLGRGEVTPYERVTAALKARGSRRMGNNWQCPAHDDQIPSLSVKESKSQDGAPSVLLNCFAGCGTVEEILPALGLEPSDLFGGSGRRQGQLFPLSRYSPVGLDILLKLPPDSSRSFVVASALGRYVSISGGREHVYSQRHIAAVIVETRHRKAILSVLGISQSQLSNQIREWRERGVAHACSQRLLTIFVREATRCPVCRSSLLDVQTPSESSLLSEQTPSESTSVDEQSVPDPVITDGGFLIRVRGEGLDLLDGVKALDGSASKKNMRPQTARNPFPEGDGAPNWEGKR
jgi:hypothetical protein